MSVTFETTVFMLKFTIIVEVTTFLQNTLHVVNRKKKKYEVNKKPGIYQKSSEIMGKPQNGKKNYNYKKGKGNFKNDKYRQKNKFNRNKPKNKYLIVKKNIERNKESEMLLKRSQLGEEN